MAIPLVTKYAFAGDGGDAPNTLIKPKALAEGDTIGVVAPGTAVQDPDDLSRMKEALDYFGLKMKLGKYVESGSGYKTRTIKERVSDLHDMFRDESVKAVFCIRGGYGSGGLLPEIDYNLIRKNPKIFIGYSDITAMHIAINQKAGMVTFHGPVLLSSFSNYTINYFKKALFSTEPIGEIRNPESKSGFRATHPIRTVVPGKAKGRLTGGNMSLICSLMGTPYEIDTKGKLLFIEDVDEEPYRIDRMLTQLKMSGKLSDAAGIIFGECNNCVPKSFNPSSAWDYSLGEVIDNILGDLNRPVFYGLTIGHTSDQATMPLGLEAEMDAGAGVVNVLEAGVV